MYYIVNHTEDILAADDELLAKLSVNTINELQKKIALNDISFTNNSSSTLQITNATATHTYDMERQVLHSILGEMTLVSLQAEETLTAEEPLSFGTEADDTFTLIDDEKESIEAPEEKISFDTDEELPFDLMSDDETPFITDEKETVVEEEPTEEPEEVAEETSEDTSPIIINITEISQKIGISTEDYNEFLNEYIDTALTLEEDLKSSKEKQKNHAITTLSHLSNVLYLPVIEKIMTNIESSDDEAQAEHIQNLYQTLARLTTTISQVDNADVATTPVTRPAESTDASESFGTIDLSNVKPIHFDFQLEEAANDLSLPVELIEEFVVDFIEQAHVETEKMLKAYEKGDLDAIQKIGHLLKGTSSNLRINPLSDTLYKIQFCEESSQLEDLIKEYWAHFLSFEHQINILTK